MYISKEIGNNHVYFNEKVHFLSPLLSFCIKTISGSQKNSIIKREKGREIMSLSYNVFRSREKK